jgi:thiamine-monophosphate kinase
MDRERQLIRRIIDRVPSRLKANPGGLRLGVGDDAAIIYPRRGKDCVASCDWFLEGAHFLADIHPPESVGYKSLARATSDIAAMGASPRWFLLALALPSEKTGSWLDRFSAGMGRAAGALGLTLVGGDITWAPKISMTLTILGEVEPGRAVTRCRARPGDLIYASGRLGQAQFGLEWIRRRLSVSSRSRKLLEQHLYPRIPLALGKWLATHRIASSMMDISDGLSTDLLRLCEMSGVGARIESRNLPCVKLPRKLPPAIRRAQLDRLTMALHGGDDYILLFTVPRRKTARLRRAPGFQHLACIGEVTRRRKVLLVDERGNTKPLPSRGWDPFRLR